ncbi:MAG: EH signature domain-containing protein, partial [Desulfomonilia bacterium]
NAVCSFGDDEFKGHLEQCLAMITHNSGIIPSEILKKKCIARIVSRYAQCVSRPEHTLLRDSAVTIIGNPWINRAAWDAFVNDETAREMINGWFKRRLITDFFQVLSEDPSADKRRLQYWLRFVPKIEDMWFALGPHAYTHHGADFKDFRKLAQDRILALENGDRPETNALIMRIDEYVFVEFGTTRNSCLVFKSNNLPFDLDNKWIYIGSRPSEQPYKLLLKHALRQDIIDTTREAKPSSKLSPKLRKHAIPT